ncbi:MAG: glycosyltransferase family 39 protein [Betaproteobacteria bacterium]|nr:glycosyltransferase family 39 protein [Betaproteobacteria bacterium]
MNPNANSHGIPAAPWLLLLCAAWILPGLVGHDPWKPDEAYSFGLVYSILKGGSWVVPTLAGEPFMEKPPLFYLTSAALAWLASPVLPLHDGARLATGLYVALALAFTGLAGRELYGRGQGWGAALVLMGCLGLLVRMHQLITDAALLAGFALAIWGLALALRRPILAGVLLGTGIGVGFMAKGLLAPGIMGIAALALPAFAPWRNRGYVVALGAAALAALPWVAVWPALLYLRSPELFSDWLMLNNFGRFLGYAKLATPTEPFYYVGILIWFAWPALPIALWALWRGGREALRQPTFQLPLVVFLVMLAVLSAAREGRDVYAVPMLLPLSLLAAEGLMSLRRGAANALLWFSVMGFTFFVGVIWFYWFALEFGAPARLHTHLHKLQPGYPAGIKWVPFAAALAYTTGWIAALFLKRSPLRPVIVWSAGITTVWALIMSLLLGWVDTGKSYRSMVVSLKQALPAKYRCIASRSLGEPQRAMLHYHGGILTEREEAKGAKRSCELLLVQTTAQEQAALDGPWKLLWEGNRPGDNEERYRLYRRNSR